MQQPVYWSVLTALALVAGAVRLLLGRPLLATRARDLGAVGLAGAVLCSLALVFHCGSMFFPAWADAIPGAQGAAAAIRRMQTASELAYWIPAALLLLCLRRVWSPALALLAVALAGVGISMYDGSTLAVHQRWLAFAIVTLTATGAALVALRRERSPRAAAHGSLSSPPA